MTYGRTAKRPNVVLRAVQQAIDAQFGSFSSLFPALKAISSLRVSGIN